MKKLSLLAVGLSSILMFSGAQAAGTVGFLRGNIWYSQEPIFAGQTVRVYSAVFNGTSNDIIGTVEFYANGGSIGTTDFTTTSGGRLREVWVDWRAVAGQQTISAKITRAAISRAGKPDEPIEVGNGESGKSEQFIDTDTDGDGIGDALDTNDDRVSTTATTPTFDTAASAAASVADTVNATADQFRAPLEAKKAELEKEIAALEKKENTFAQTEVGAEINEATNGSTVVASRPTSTPTDTLMRIAKQLYLFTVVAALYILDHKMLLYIILALILYKLVRFVLRRIITRRNTY